MKRSHRASLVSVFGRGCLVVCAGCGTSGASADAGAEASRSDARDEAPSEDATADAGSEARADAACPAPFDIGRPDAGGFCCCRFDVVSTPTCEADGSLSCPASSQLYSGLDCLGVHCTNPSNLGDGSADANDAGDGTSGD